MINTIIISGKVFHRDEYSGDFNELILKNLDEKSVKRFSEHQFEMIKRCNCPETELSEFETEDLVDELESSGFIIFKPKSIVDEIRINEILDR